MSSTPTIAALGESAWIITFGTELSRDLAARAVAAADRIRAARIRGVVDVVPAYASVAIHVRTDQSGLISSDALLALATNARARQNAAPRTIEIPVAYDGEDLAWVASELGSSIEAVIQRHASRDYHAYALGFAPGFAYLGELDPELVLPRRSTPRVRVPAGSVAIAGRQTAVYPIESPGGWHIIGHTETAMFDMSRDEPALIRAGDTVRFVRRDV